MTNTTPLTVALLGCGNLRTALAAGILNPINGDAVDVNHLIATVGSEASQRCVQDALSKHSSRLTVLLAQENVRAVQEADVVLLAFKPVKREEVFGALGFKEVLRGKLVISIMAGISIKELNRLALEGKDALKDPSPLQAVRAP
ncbi:hypothetical protein CDV36_012992 [Fusarium kuroshium]|uniref:Pyrroline-5-carboxylate reductase catalytic N-terminal domain-containing protein n=2 Tax=Fusarium solani species complex TaxID=232080 RepID=A0A3M2RQ45_9HYPO|nr:hypothetical protein CDV36_012992 [Fusarium kuroshium]RSL92418.1 hypothetical protein CEP52_013835 [Fusarium oligoseptatum]